MKIICYIATLTIAVVAALNVNIVPNKELSEISFANIEALANMPVTLDCWDSVSSSGSSAQTHVTYCGDCDAILCRTWETSSTCTK